MEDEKIIALYFERDESAIRESEKKYGKYCYAIAHRILHSHEDAEECVNDTWCGAWEAMPPQRPTKLQYFLARITRNVAIDRYRHASAQKRGAEVECAIEEYWECIPNGEAPIEDELVLREAINGFLATLDAHTRVIFLRRYFYAMSVREIAEGMRLSENRVSVTLHRTRSKFKAYLTQKGILI